MGIGVSLFLVAVGAILAFAVTETVQGIDLVAVGWILMVVGVVGGVASMIFWGSWGGFGRRERSVIVERDHGDLL